jgi:hypothetical protein
MFQTAHNLKEEEVIGDTIREVLGEDSKALERIRPDLNIEKWTIWQPAKSKNAPNVRVFERAVTLPDGGKLTAQVEIGFTQYGTITTEEQKVYWALVKCWEDKGCSEEFTHFSLRELAKLLKKKWGTNVIDSLTKSLNLLRVTPIIWRNSYYDSSTGETVKELRPFTLLSELKIAQKENDGVVNQASGYFQFDRHLLANLENNHTKPLLFDVAISFKSEIAQLLYPYVDLVMADKTHYERRTKEFCNDLGLKGKMYGYLSGRRRAFLPALKEVEGKPLSTGVLTSVTIEKTSDGKDYKVVFQKAKQKQRSQSQPSTRTDKPTTTDLTGLAKELHDRGINPKKARELVGRHSEDYLREKVEMFDFVKSSGQALENPPGYLIRMIEDNYQLSEEQEQRIQSQAKRKEQEEHKEQITQLEEVKKGVVEMRRIAREDVIQEILTENPSVIETAVTKIQLPILQRALTEYPSAHEAYQKSPMIQFEIERILREEIYRQPFLEAEKTFNERIAAIDKQIEELKK